jgi:anti-sigma regulatory factor (Ser/Thr protein kinase)
MTTSASSPKNEGDELSRGKVWCGQLETEEGRGDLGMPSPGRMPSIDRSPDLDGQTEVRVPLRRTAEDLSTVRRAVGDVIARCRAEVDLAEVRLLADELTANAVRHAGGATDVLIRGSADAVYVEVTDASPALPVPARPGPNDDQGRGLLLVERLASAWGTRVPPGGGKTVWFEIRARPSSMPAARDKKTEDGR